VSPVSNPADGCGIAPRACNEAGTELLPNEIGLLKQAALPDRLNPAHQKRWLMPSVWRFESVLAAAVTPPEKPARAETICAQLWVLSYTVTALMSVCLDGS
jgi:hypothetical protein